MENFRPPAMDEVVSQKRKKKALTFTIVLVLISVIGIGSYIGVKRLRVYLNYLAVEKKHQLLSDFYKAIVAQDVDTLQKIAPNVVLINEYNFINNAGNYSLYVFPNSDSNKDISLFTLVDNSTIPNIPHLKQVTYGRGENNQIQIIEIAELGIGSQIN